MPRTSEKSTAKRAPEVGSAAAEYRACLSKDNFKAALENGKAKGILDSISSNSEHPDLQSLLPALFKRLIVVLTTKEASTEDVARAFVAKELIARPEWIASIHSRIDDLMSSHDKSLASLGMDFLSGLAGIQTILGDTSATILTKPLLDEALLSGAKDKKRLSIITKLVPLAETQDIPQSLLTDLLYTLSVSANPALHGKAICLLLQNEEYLLGQAMSSDQPTDLNSRVAQVLASRLTSGGESARVISVYVLPEVIGKSKSLALAILKHLESPLPSSSTSTSTSSSAQAQLSGWVEASSVAITQGLLKPSELSLTRLEEALLHANDDIRLAGFKILISTKATSDLIDEGSWIHIRRWIEDNVNVYSAEFRSEFASLIRKLFIRLHHSLTKMKREVKHALEGKDLKSSTLTSYQVQVNNLMTFILNNVLNSALELPLSTSHAKIITCLDMLIAVAGLEGVVMEGIEVFSAERTEYLLACLGSNYTDVRRMAMQLLEQAPSPLPGYSDATSTLRLKEAAYLTVTGARNTDAEAGRLVLQVLFQKFIATADSGILVNSSLKEVMDRLLTHVEAVEKDLVTGLHDKPLHGLLSILEGYLSALHQDRARFSSLIQSLLSQLIPILQRVWKSCSVILGGPSEASAESHEIAKIYEALEEEDTGSGEHIVVLSNCWRAMKESADFLSTLVCGGVDSAATTNNLPITWDAEQLAATGDLFRTWLFNIRHRGTFSSIALAFERFVNVVRVNEQASGGNLCRQWLETDLQSILEGLQSTTRRSAALPFCILALVQGDKEAALSASHVLLDAVQLQSTVPVQAQVHAFNILRVILLDTRQATILPDVMEDAMLASLKIFNHINWSLRNAALLLASTLLNRMFGPRLNHQTSSLAISTKTWHAQYPRLMDLIEPFLKETNESQTAFAFPLLLLIAQLQAVEDGPEWQIPLMNTVNPFLCSPDIRVRMLSARAAAALTISKWRTRTILAFCKALTAGRWTSVNEAHGQACYIRCLASQIPAVGNSEDSSVILLKLATAARGLRNLPAQPSELQSAVVDILDLLVKKGYVIEETELASHSAPTEDVRSPGHFWKVALSSAQDSESRIMALAQLQNSTGSAPATAKDRLTKLCTTRKCVPLAEAALSVLASLCGRTNDLAVLLRLIADYGDDEQSVESRSAAVEAVAALLSASSEPLPLEVYTLLRKFLSDDDLELRLRASSIVASAIRTSPKSREESKRMLEVYMSSVYDGTEEWTNWVSRLLRDKALLDSHHPTAQNDLALFAQEPSNLYRDPLDDFNFACSQTQGKRLNDALAKDVELAEAEWQALGPLQPVDARRESRLIVQKMTARLL